MRDPPGDILLGLAFSELLLSIHWLMMAAYSLKYKEPYQSEDNFCQIQSAIGILGGTLELLYNCGFYLNIILQLKSSLKDSTFNTKYIHVVAWLAGILVTLGVFIIKQTGKNLYGTCSFKAGVNFPYLSVMLILCYLIVSYISMRTVSKKFPNRITRKKLKIQFLTFAKRQIQACVFLWSVLFISNILVYCNCRYENWRNLNFQVWMVIIGNLAKALTPCVLPMIRLMDPFIRQMYHKQRDNQKIGIMDLQRNQSQLIQFAKLDYSQDSNFEELVKKNNQEKKDLYQQYNVNFEQNSLNQSMIIDKNNNVIIKENSQINSEKRIELQTYSNNDLKLQSQSSSLQNSSTIQQNPGFKDKKIENIVIPQRKKSESEGVKGSVKSPEKSPTKTQNILRQHTQQESIKENIQTIQKFTQMLRTAHIYKMLTSIILYYKKDGQQPLFKKENTSDPYTETFTYQIDEDTIKHIYPDLPQFIFEDIYKNSSKNKKKLIVHAPNIFQNIQLLCGKSIQLDENLDTQKNSVQIANASGNDGGKSGQFFFFSYDSCLVLKTITKQELGIMKKILNRYHTHMNLNPNSLIAKILGIFQFDNFDDDPIFLILMENMLQGCPVKNVLKIYDMKGSTFDREVLVKAGKEVSNTSTLKDLDFLKLEQSVKINLNKAQETALQLQKDSDFLCQQGLIDYSLILIKMQNSDKFSFKQENNHRSKFLEQEGAYYCFGIIDYLETYRIQKKLEKYAKKFIKCNRKLDTSSQGPKTYSQRFKKFIEVIFLENQKLQKESGKSQNISISLNNNSINELKQDENENISTNKRKLLN